MSLRIPDIVEKSRICCKARHSPPGEALLRMTPMRLCLALALVAATGRLAAALDVPSNIVLLNQPQPSLAAIAPTVVFNGSTNLELLPLSSNSSSVESLGLPPDTPIGCYHNGPRFQKQFRPIVLEDCFPLFGQILLSPEVLLPRSWDPQSTHESYRRQNGNCIFEVTPGTRAIPSSFSEISVGIQMARIVLECVNTRTGYLGGQKKTSQSSEWIISVFAAGPP